MTRLQQLRRNQSGMSYVFVGFGFMAMLAASMLAIDVGMLMTARSQAQNSADAGALAGATALLHDSFTDRSASGPAVTSAIRAGKSNAVASGEVSLNPGDVQFPMNPRTGQPDLVRVTVYRSSTRGNPFDTLIAKYFGIATAGVNAVATAEAAPANAMACVKPFTIPDKWDERQTPGWSEDDTFEAYDRHSRPLPNPDIYIGANEDGYTGYDSWRDKGTRLMIRAGTGNNIMPSFYFSLALETVTGASTYEENICGCNTTLMHWGELMLVEPGNMVGPTMQGIDCLMAKDPSATWDVDTNSVRSDMGIHSPRIFPIPLYDPVYYDSGKLNGRNADLKVANWIGFFLEGRQGNNVYGRITPILGLYDKSAGPAPKNAFPRAIRLVQ